MASARISVNEHRKGETCVTETDFSKGQCMDLVPIEMLEAKVADFDARREELPRQYDLALLDDPVAGRVLMFYLLLTEMPGLLSDQRLTPEQVFWSRCYWFLLFARLREATAGPDAGLEQQAIQILEHPPDGLSPDWTMLEEVEAAVERSAAASVLAAHQRPPSGLPRSGDHRTGQEEEG
jgi:hypothetical protein